MQLYSMISYIRTESFFQTTEAAIKWLKVQLEKYGALSASSAKSGSVRLWGYASIGFVSGTGEQGEIMYDLAIASQQ
jgi:hypothetical protein